jgi:photosystem II stability/assembly factor-like uncharacterized protein
MFVLSSSTHLRGSNMRVKFFSKCIFLFFLIIFVLLINENSFGQWHRIGIEGKYISCIGSDGGKLFAGTQDRIWSTSDGGLNWSFSVLNAESFFLKRFGPKIFLGTASGVMTSMDSGITWGESNNGFRPNPTVLSFIMMDTNLFAGTWEQGLYSSVDFGKTWNERSMGLQPYGEIYAFANDGNNIYAATNQLGGVMLSTDRGLNWAGSGTDMASDPPNSIIVIGNIVLTSFERFGILVSYDSTRHWSSVADPRTTWVYCLSTDGSNIFAGTNYGVLVSIDTGKSWREINEGLSTRTIRCISLINKDIFIGTDDGIWKRSLQNVLEVRKINREKGGSLIVDQNIFSRFSTTSSAIFSTTNPGKVQLYLQNITGAIVKTLFDSYIETGFHEIFFTTADLPNGIYIISAGGACSANPKKIIVQK